MTMRAGKPRHSRRRATAYAVVIGATALVTVMGLSALTAIRLESRTGDDVGDLGKAMLYARSAIEKGLYIIDNDSSWRLNRLSGVWEQDKPIGDGTYTLEGRDLFDGVLANMLYDPLWLEGTGVAGNARYKLRVEVQPTGGGYSCLEVPFHSKNNLTFTGATVTSNGPISSNNSVQVTTSLVTANLEAVNTISGTVIVGSSTTGITARVMPDTTLFDFYTNPTYATQISMVTLPKISGDKTIQDATISSTSNPYGAPNANGLYYIDCAGSKLVIRNSKIDATLTVINAVDVKLKDSMSWAKPANGYPSLLVQGNLSIEVSATSFLLGLDLLPSVIRGLFYGSGTLGVKDNVSVIGVVVGGSTSSVNGTLSLTYDSTFLSDPPPGFGTPTTMEVVEGSWQRLVD